MGISSCCVMLLLLRCGNNFVELQSFFLYYSRIGESHFVNCVTVVMDQYYGAWLGGGGGYCDE